jgi:hypothetical protein
LRTRRCIQAGVTTTWLYMLVQEALPTPYGILKASGIIATLRVSTRRIRDGLHIYKWLSMSEVATVYYGLWDACCSSKYQMARRVSSFLQFGPLQIWVNNMAVSPVAVCGRKPADPSADTPSSIGGKDAKWLQE